MALIHAATTTFPPDALCGDRDGHTDYNAARVNCGSCLDIMDDEDEPDSVKGTPV